MANVDKLALNVWEADFAPTDTLALTRFRLASDATDTLLQWSGEKSRRSEGKPSNLRLDGLSEMLAWFVPEIAFVRSNNWDPETRSKHLDFFLVGDAPTDGDLRKRVRAGISNWLTLLYSEKAGPARAAIAETAMNAASWTKLEVSCALREQEGACPAPVDGMMFDAIAAHALVRLAGHDLRFRSGTQRVLVAKTAQSAAFNGVELVAFPPRQTERGLWSEVITLYTPTYPERGKLHVLARPSIRNWGPVTSWSGRNDPNRALDVFMPAMDDSAGGAYRHTSFDFRARPGDKPLDGGRTPVVGFWPHRDDQRIFDLVRRLTGRAALAPRELAEPIVDQDGLWVLPRLGTIHGDDWLPGGTGISWPDRQDIGESLDRAFADAGFKAVEPMQRARTRMPLDRSFNSSDSDTTFQARRLAVRNALEANGVTSGALDLFIFQRLEETPQLVASCLVAELGAAESVEPGRILWTDGLSINLHAINAGPLADEISWADITAEQQKALSSAQQKSIREMNRGDAFEAAKAKMVGHVRAARSSGNSVGCAILEMAAGLRDRPGDPFQIARWALAQCNLLPQVVLTSPDPVADATRNSIYGSAVSDCFRMLGVLPVEDVPGDLRPAALTVIQRNTEMIAGAQRKGHAFPLAARTNDGRLECAIPDETGTPVWAPYAATALRILQGDYGKFGRGRDPENQTKFETFFTMALEDISRVGPALVICEGETLTHKFEALRNGRLAFDRMVIANRIFTPADLPGVRIVRTSPDPKRQPYYYHDTANTWPSGLFSWGDATRTYYGLKQKPVTVSKAQHFASKVSRHAVADEGVRAPKDSTGRVSSQMDEICVTFLQEGDEPIFLATLVHRLRGAHAQYDADTARPFPLHELRRLGGGITL